MTTLTKQRARTRVRDLASWIPTVPPLEDEAFFDATRHASAFLGAFSSAVSGRDWAAFADLFAEQCWWRDSLTLTFDKRTIHGRAEISAAWASLSETRKPARFTAEKTRALDMEAALVRLHPGLAVLEVPFAFETEAPGSSCVGQAKLVPVEGEGWKIWILTTAVVELRDRPFGPLPRAAAAAADGAVGREQRGRATAQGLPGFGAGVVLDAVVVGGSCNGIASAMQLDMAGADVAVFDRETRAGGNWTTRRYDSVTLHHPKFMISLPGFPVPDEFPEYLPGRDLTRYYSMAVEELKLPFFGGVEVVANVWEEDAGVWDVLVRDVRTREEERFKARNVLITTGYIASPDNAVAPVLEDREVFGGPVLHTADIRGTEMYRGKDVVIVGSGNSGHDIAAQLVADPEVGKVTILQRSPSALMDMDKVLALIAARYMGQMSVDTADFMENTMPMGIMRNMAVAGLGAIMEAAKERCDAFEEKGYLVDRHPDLLMRQFEERGRNFYVDQPGTFDLVFADKIKIARGEARSFVGEGLVVVDLATGEERVEKAGGVIFATGYEVVDLPKKYAESGFLDKESASKLENVSLMGVDEEGECPGLLTFSGHPHLYFAGFGIFTCRWTSRYAAVQVLADVEGQFPERYARACRS
ncbi:putative indole-3-pyruvate monooxygenase YUCCA7 [Colletotrichum spinosum]|uniref:Putative indole-3-pyruvate monooxygenase YUCCA7 n=1 Tax=Colletotrichum spinosum TaxID=1347390 RepID=A0A4V3HT64_9PEZI|nr:putative indole-3-pyruvate monooxygenase YUCCA7 [Colletotrichum spinosum]